MLEYLVLIPSLALSLSIVVPLTGVLVRFRANYTPRGLALDNEGSAVPHTGPEVNSYFGMFDVFTFCSSSVNMNLSDVQTCLAD